MTLFVSFEPSNAYYQLHFLHNSMQQRLKRFFFCKGDSNSHPLTLYNQQQWGILYRIISIIALHTLQKKIKRFET